MTKVNPVMKHAQAKPVPAVKKNQRVSVEDFMNTIPPALIQEGDVMIDNSPAEWIEIEDTSLDPIVESADVAGQLDDLAMDVDVSTTAASMESYRRIFGQLTNLSGHPIPATVALESFPQTKGGKRQLAKAIRSHADLIRGCMLTALEDYVDNADSSIGKIVADYKQALGTLGNISSSLEVPETPVKIDHKKIWEMWFIDGSIMKPTEVSKEISAVEDLATVISKATDHAISFMGKEEGDKNVDRAGKIIDKVMGNDSSRDTALPNHKDINLMFNTKVEFKDGRARFSKEKVAEAGRNWSGADFGWLAFWGIFGGPIGLLGAAAYRGAKGGTGEKDTKRKNSVREMHAFIDGIKKLAPIVNSIEQEVEQLNSAIKAAPAERQAVFKRSAAPVLELASKTIAHITEVTYGAKTLFEKIKEAD